jgi:hypothetical protein
MRSQYLKKQPGACQAVNQFGSAVSPPEEGKSKEGEQKRPKKEWRPAETEKWSDSFVIFIRVVAGIISARAGEAAAAGETAAGEAAAGEAAAAGETATGQTAAGEAATGQTAAGEAGSEMPEPWRSEPGITHPGEEKWRAPERRSAETIGSFFFSKRSYIIKLIFHSITSKIIGMLYIMLIRIIRLHNIHYLLRKKQGRNWMIKADESS